MSMTGFGKAVGEYGGKRFTVEVKSLNSKQMDLFMRWPGIYKEIELDARSTVANYLHKGKVDFVLSVETLSGESATKVNLAALKSYKEQISNAAKELGVAEPQDWMKIMLRLPDVMQSETQEIEMAELEAVNDTVRRALEALVDFRKTEGKSLRAVFEKNLNSISSLLKEIEPYEKGRVESIKAKLIQRLQQVNVEFDRNRLEQEMIYYIEKLDINEEKVRLRQHCKYFMDTLDGEPYPGKKLGFIIQEMGREINTTGSKANHAAIQQCVVRMKDELEKIREQSMNIL